MPVQKLLLSDLAFAVILAFAATLSFVSAPLRAQDVTSAHQDGLPGEPTGQSGTGKDVECVSKEDIRPDPPDIFGLAALPVASKSLLHSWLSARESPFMELDNKAYLELSQQLRNGAVEPIDTINRWVNWHVRFVEDLEDRWASAGETLARGYGDCEDLAILKMALLERTGIDSGAMYLVLVRERFSPVSHAVLAVRRGDEMLILDNRTDELRQSHEISDYYPTVSFSMNFAWVYGLAKLGLGSLISNSNVGRTKDDSCGVQC